MKDNTDPHVRLPQGLKMDPEGSLRGYFTSQKSNDGLLWTPNVPN